jgi:replication initiation protein RepC
MEEENRAQGAPRGSVARHPTGFRRLTPGLLKVDRTADGFDGLPDGVTSPGQLLAAFKAAAARLGVAPRLVHALDWLFRFTQPQDWEEGRRPIVWPSAAMQQDALGLSERQTRRLNRALIEFGLVTVRDSPNGKRYGHRDPKGQIVEAYGFDLSPLAARHAEFVRVAEQARAERALMGRLRRRATIARKAIAQILETATEYGFDSAEWQTLARETVDLVRALRAVESLDAMEAGVRRLEGRQSAARERLETLLESVEMTGSGVKNVPRIYNYNTSFHPDQDTVITSEECSGVAERPSVRPWSPETRHHPAKARIHGIVPDELVRLTPKLGSYLKQSSPTWPDLVDAADWLRHDLGVSRYLWGEACLAMGRELAAVALAIVSAKEPRHFRTTPGGYFHGMVAKAKAGELHLERTLWALRNAAATGHGRDNGGRRPGARH